MLGAYSASSRTGMERWTRNEEDVKPFILDFPSSLSLFFSKREIEVSIKLIFNRNVENCKLNSSKCLGQAVNNTHSLNTFDSIKCELGFQTQLDPDKDTSVQQA